MIRTGIHVKIIILKCFIANIALLFSFPVFSQHFLTEDTIVIKEVVIRRKFPPSVLTGYNKTILAPELLNNYRQVNLAEVISENSLIFVKSYGMGGSATTSIRGSGASHTQIMWNEINLNNPMTGQSDLSLIPACFIDNVQIYYGGSSMGLNSGGIGGIINLETNTGWKKETSMIFNPGIGSFGRYTGSFQIKSGSTKFQTVTKIFLESAENNFRYLNNVISAEPVWEKRKNSQLRQQGYLQELYFRNAKSVISARLWYQTASRNLPAPIVVQLLNAGEKQYDESLKTMLNFKTYTGSFKYSVTGALMLNRLNYINSLASIDSKNLSEKLVLKSVTETTFSDNIVFKTSLNDELSVIRSNNYDKSASRNVMNLTVSLEKKREDWWGSTLLVREIINNRSFLIPDFTAGLEFKISKVKEYTLKGNISRNSKVPDMNDIFWIPGGNLNLKNEYVTSGELIYGMNEKISSAVRLYIDISLFRNSIKDMIQWHPGEFSYWTADNIQRVNSMGVESSAGLRWTHNKLTAKIDIKYSYTGAKAGGTISSGEALKGKQLIYIPENKSNATFSILYKNFNILWMADYTGKRYITVDNTGYLPGFILNNLKAGFRFNINDDPLELHLSVNNLFNVGYQIIAWQPMPGRYYSFGILFNLIKLSL